ncbi:MAG: hypothetical protein SW833_04215 [Cyanobacteriota bacterium]|nr:hypothetical protein [Cyanobacteriota bacterium]
MGLFFGEVDEEGVEVGDRDFGDFADNRERDLVLDRVERSVKLNPSDPQFLASSRLRGSCRLGEIGKSESDLLKQ